MSKKNKHVINRDMMANGELEAMILRDSPDQVILTADEREESLQQALSERPNNQTWLFAYGSLIWNPTIHYIEQRIGTVKNWHRSFCLSVTSGRGSIEQPGLVLALDHGGHCTGVAYRIDEDLLEEELRIVWRREMVSGSYVPMWLPIYDENDCEFGHALTFTIKHSSTQYAGNLSESEIIHRLAHAKGGLGSAADYLINTCDGLRQSNIADENLLQLEQNVLKVKKDR